MSYTIFGANGFIGNALYVYLKAKGHNVYTPDIRSDTPLKAHLGHVIYCIGMTGNFRGQPEKTIESHVDILQKYINLNNFDSWLYLSSTRVYANSINTNEEEPICIRPSADSLYDLSKLLGESICLSHEQSTVRITRLSNVYGPGQNENMFLGRILKDLKENNKTVIQEAPESSKNYIYIDDVVEILEKISTSGKGRLYNIASEANTTHRTISDIITSYGYDVSFQPDANARIFPHINTHKASSEFGFSPRCISETLPSLLKNL